MVLSSGGKSSATTFTPPEKFPDSAAPNKKRKKLNENTPRERLVKMLASDHTKTDRVKPSRGPTQSMNRPENSWPMPYVKRNALIIRARSEAFKLNWVVIAG